MKSKYFFRVFNSLLLLAFVSLSFMASNCNDIIDALTNSGDVTGSWIMTDQAGAQYDLCNQERVVFSGTTATLTCPNSTPVTRAYTTSNGVLTYTETGVSYTYNVTTNSGNTILTMTGRNGVNRTIEYTKQTTDNVSSGVQQPKEKQNLLNSSDSK